jgi:hypothetical protein
VSSQEAGYLTVHLSPESFALDQQPASLPAGASAEGRQLQWSSRNFSLAVSGLDTKTVSRIEPFSMTLKMADQIGVFRVTKNPARLEWGFLTVTFPAAEAPGWIAWRDDFLMNGHHQEENERSLVLTFLARDLKTPLLELNGSGVGLVTVRRLPTAAGDAAPKYQAQLYVQQWSLGKGMKGS